MPAARTAARTRVVEVAEIYVGNKDGIFTTGPVNRKRAHSTVSSLRAATALAQKLFGQRLQRLDFRGRAPAGKIDFYVAEATPETTQ